MSDHPAQVQPLQSTAKRSRLDNGLALTLVSRPGQGKAAICLRVAAGSHDEPTEYPGLAHFLEHLLFLGSEGYGPEQSLMAFVQACGGQVNASTQARHTDYFCEVPAALLDGALARLLDMLAHPLLDPAAQLREREVVHAEFLARGQDGATLAAAALGQALPAGHGCGAFVAGNRETLAVERDAFQRALRAFHRRYYRAAQCSLVLVGPQPPAELEALARRHAAALPALPGSVQAAPPALLPLRERQLRMTLAPGAACLRLGFALDLPAAFAGAALDQALDYLLTWLADESSGGLSAGLVAASLCSGLQAQVLYRHAGQVLLMLAFADVEEDPASRAAIAAAVQDWLGFFAAHADAGDLRGRYRALLACRLQALQPLALARFHQDLGLDDDAPGQCLSEAGRIALSRLLEQLRATERCIALYASPVVVAPWQGTGFPLRMASEAGIAAAPRNWAWQLPAANPFACTQAGSEPALEIEARLRWLQSTAAAAGPGQGALLARLCLVEALNADRLQALVQARLGEVQGQAAQVGITLQLTAEADALQLSLQGPAQLLPRVLAHALRRLFDSTATPRPSAPAADMPIRRLLRRLPDLFSRETVAPGCPAQALRQARLEGLGVGLGEAALREIEGLFASAPGLLPAAAPAPVQPGRHWRAVPGADEEAALLLFCAQPGADARSEAGWRLLAHLLQGPFHRRLRSDLQLGYAMFCGYRQVRGRRGILFAVQSPHASAQQILAHIEAFLDEQGECLKRLDEAALSTAAEALGRQLRERAGSVAELAELHWQQHLAGLPPAHGAVVEAALTALSRQDLLALHRSLCQARGGWHLLANAAD